MTEKVKVLEVDTPQGPAGRLTREARFVFNYATGERSREVSLVMPIRAESYASAVLPSVFAMNRPEGFLLHKLVSRFAKAGGLDDMKMLALVGENQIGRLRFREAGAKGRREGPKERIGLKELLARQQSAELFEFLVDTYWQSGISGVQPKVMVPDFDKPSALDHRATVVHSSLIVKAGGDEYPHLAENEFLCMEAARRSGIMVPQFWLSDDSGLFIMDRFDLDGDKQLGFEDMFVLMGKQVDPHGEGKYQGSYEGIAKAVQLYAGEAALESLHRFFGYVALSVMVRNGDAHLKNFGMLYEHPAAEQRPTLAPLYDVVTTTVYAVRNERTGLSKVDRTMALKLHKDKGYPHRERLLQFGADACHVEKPAQVLERIADGMTVTLRDCAPRIEAGFLADMQKEWDAGRMSIEPRRFFGPRRESEPGTRLYSGAIVAVEGDEVVQKVGRDPGQVMRHPAASLSRVPTVGEVVDITVGEDGRGIVQGVGRVVER